MDDASSAPSPCTIPGTSASPIESSIFDPYVFQADDHVSNFAANSNCHGTKSSLLSIHPKTFLPPGNPSSHVTSIQCESEKVTDAFHHPFVDFLHSSSLGAQSLTHVQQCVQPSSKLETNPGFLIPEKQFGVKQIQLQTHISKSKSVFTQNVGHRKETDLNREKPKKKRKQKQVEDQEIKVASLPPDCEDLDYPTVRDGCSVGNKTQSEQVGDQKIPGPHPATSDLQVCLPSFATGNYPTSVVQTAATTTCTSSVQTFSEDKGLFPDHVDFPVSRPSSRTSTLSSSSHSSEGKTKDGADAVSMSKIMQIIEREKKLGSSSPSKRRRTAKPLHIQEAEEEAKRYAAANAVQGVITNATEKLHPSPSVIGDITTSSEAKVKCSLSSNSRLSSPNLLGSSQISNGPSKAQDGKKLLQLPDHSVRDNVCHNVTLVNEKDNVCSTSDIGCLGPADKMSATSSVTGEMGLSKSSSSYNHHSMVTSKIPLNADQKDKMLKAGILPSISDITSKHDEMSCFVGESDSVHCGQIVKQQNTENGPTDYFQNVHNISVLPSSDKPVVETYVKMGKLHHSHTADIKDNSYGPDALSSTSNQNFTQGSFKSGIDNHVHNDHLSNIPASSSVENKSNLSSENISHSLFHPALLTPIKTPWLNKLEAKEIVSTEQVIGASDVLVNFGLQGLKSPAPACESSSAQLISDKDKTGYQTERIFSGKDALPSNHSLCNVKHAVTHIKPEENQSLNLPKKQLSSDSFSKTLPSSVPAKADISQSTLSVDKSDCNGMISQRILPPFDAFAGMKMDITSQSFKYMPYETQKEPMHTSLLGRGVSYQTIKNFGKNAVHHSAQSGYESTDKKLVKNSISEESLRTRNKDHLKTVGSNNESDLIAFGDIQLAAKPTNSCPDSHVLDADCITNKQSVSGGLKNLNIPHNDQQSNFLAENSGNVRQRVGVENMVNKVCIVCGNAMNGSPVTISGNTQLNEVCLNCHINGKRSPSEPASGVMDTDYKSKGQAQHCVVSSLEKVLDNCVTQRMAPLGSYTTTGRIPNWNTEISHRTSGCRPANPVCVGQVPSVDKTNAVSAGSIPVNSYATQNVRWLIKNEMGQKVPVSVSQISDKSKSSVKAAPLINGENKTAIIDSPISGKKLKVNSQKKVLDLKLADSAKPVGASGRTVSIGTHVSHGPMSFDTKMKTNNVSPLNGTMYNFNGSMHHVNGSSSKFPISQPPELEATFTHMTAEEELADRLRNNKTEPVPKCNCHGPNYEFNENVEGPYYTQLGKARDIPGLRALMEKRTGLSGKAIRIEKILYSGKEGRTQEGCPIAKWIIRRSGPEEKYLCVARRRPGHTCDAAYIVVVIVAWEGVMSHQADSLYSYLVSTLPKHGQETDRRCGTNESKTCACQGVDLLRRGASFSFGCSWSMYYNGCKFARSNIVRKFRLKDSKEEEKIEEHLQDLATQVGPLYKVVAPDAYRNQTNFEEQASMCRLGREKGKPFSGVTACVDFCAHSHKDFHNMQNGSTVVVTLTKHRGLSKPDDEQLHVLPLYVLDKTDEDGTVEGQIKKEQSGALEILRKYSVQARMRAAPLKKAKRGAKKDSVNKGNTGKNNCLSSPVGIRNSCVGTNTIPPTPPKARDVSFLQSQDSSQFLPDTSISGNTTMHYTEKRLDGSCPSFLERENSSNPDDFMSQNFESLDGCGKTGGLCYPPPHTAIGQQTMMSPTTYNSNNGAKDCGSNTKSSHQTSSQPPFQAAVFQQNVSLPSVMSPHSPSCLPSTYKMKTEADYSSDFHNAVGITHSAELSDGRTNFFMSEDVSSISKKASNTKLLGGNITTLPSVGGNVGNPDIITGKTGNIIKSSQSHLAGVPVNFHSSPASLRCVPPSSPGECNLSVDLNYPNQPCPHSSSNVHNIHSCNPYMNQMPSCDGTLAPPLCNDMPNFSTQSKTVMQPCGTLVTPTQDQGVDEPDYAMIDPSVVRCEWQDNTESFHDSRIGGVAISLIHGAVLFEVAKRELHATTALKNPNRFHPTRISLVFYQHKNLNYFHHGYYEYERKLATQRSKRIKEMMEKGATAEEAEEAVKPGKKRKKKALEGTEEEEEKIDFAKTSAAQYKYMWDTTVRQNVNLTTDSIITRWIDPQPMVTGPYQRWV